MVSAAQAARRRRLGSPIAHLVLRTAAGSIGSTLYRLGKSPATPQAATGSALSRQSRRPSWSRRPPRHPSARILGS